MINDSKDFKDNINVLLQDIKVSDDLKKRTIKKCLNRKTRWIKASMLSSAAVIVFAIIISSTYKSRFGIKSDNLSKADKSPKAPISTPSPETSDLALDTKGKDTSKEKSVNTVESGNNETSSNKLIADNSSIPEAVNKSAGENVPKTNGTPEYPAASRGPVPNSSMPKNSSPKSLTAPAPAFNGEDMVSCAPPTCTASTSSNNDELIKEAENLLGSNIIFPTYIPEGYTLTNVLLPDKSSETSSLCVKLIYSCDNNSFNLTELIKKDTLTASASMAPMAPKAMISIEMQAPEITWEDNKMKYSLSGNLPQNILSDIAKSMGKK